MTLVLDLYYRPPRCFCRGIFRNPTRFTNFLHIYTLGILWQNIYGYCDSVFLDFDKEFLHMDLSLLSFRINILAD